MIDHSLDTISSILYVRPTGTLEQGDFTPLAKAVDLHIEQAGALKGLVIDAPEFPGWQGIGAMADHFRFIHDHHKHIKKIALVTDSALGDVAERFASHFVSAEIKHFPAGQIKVAKDWILER